MAYVNVLTGGAITSTTVAMSALASGGTGPYTYAFYGSQTNGFTPGAGNKLSGAATGPTFTATGLLPGSTWYFVSISDDTGNAGALATSNQITEITNGVTLATTTVTPSSVALSASATGGVSPYTYAFYASQTTGFTPGPSNKISGSATGPTFTYTGLIQGAKWFFAVIATDSAAATVTSAQLTVVTTNTGQQPLQNIPTPVLGMSDMFRNMNTLGVLVSATQATPILPGAALVWVTAVGSPPIVVESTSTADLIAGFAYYSTKDTGFAANTMLDMARAGNVIYLIAATTVSRGNFLTSLPRTTGGGVGYVTPTTGSSGLCIVGEALDNATAGQPFRVELLTGLNLLDNGDVN